MKNNSYNETTEKFGHSQNLDVDFVAKCEISNKEGQPGKKTKINTHPDL